jgi:5-methylcytosine-specific restriction protein B
MSTELTTEVLRKLRQHRLVLIAGPPGVGKSRLLAQVRAAFTSEVAALPAYQPTNHSDPFPPVMLAADEASDWFPSPERTDRAVFTTTFHPNYRYRDFMRGVAPKIGVGAGFMVTSGKMYKAALHALEDNGAALLIIDEINRGPAVQIFGDSIVAIESDKRRGQRNALPFQMLNDEGEYEDFELPSDLYILAAMNQADTSVESLDVAFLRRWEPLRLDPDETVLRAHYGLESGALTLPDRPSTAHDVYAAAISAWVKVNERISLGRGPEFQIGHGIFPLSEESPNEVDAALRFVADPWQRIRTHVDEVFFGNVSGVAAVLNAGSVGNPVRLEEVPFGSMPALRLAGEAGADLYGLLRSVSAEDAQ